MRNPILIELTRGALVESAHAGVVAVAHADGRLVAAVGDTAAPVFPRSAIKPLQALPFLETGAVQRFGFGPAEIAVACASHSGTPRHVAVVEGLLARAGLTPAALGCGVHEPFDAAVARDMIRRGERPTSLHHNCSGKHAAMLATAAHLGEPTDGYWLPDHPVQVRIRRVLEELTGCSLTPEVCGIDGCSVPNWADAAGGTCPRLRSLRIRHRPDPATRRRLHAHLRRVYGSPRSGGGPGPVRHPHDAAPARQGAGQDRSRGRLLRRPAQAGLGFALKIEDGAKRASEAVAAHIIARFHPEAQDAAPDAVLRNWRGLDVGRMRATPDLEAMLAACGPQ